MFKKQFWGLLSILSVAAWLQAHPSPALALQKEERSLDCNDTWRNGRLATHCDMREQTIPALGGTLAVDGRMNGSISMRGWNRSDILIRAKVQTSAPTDSEATDVARQIVIETNGSRIRAEGPSQGRDLNWSVSYEVFVPQTSNLSLTTHNGGIRISDIRGRVEFTAINGGVSLRRLAGSVRGDTTNGGLSIELAGTQWEGDGLDVRTTNGGITMWVPENYSAQLETGTVNGGLNVDFPITVQGRLNRELSVKLGYGGPMVRAMTTNGGVRIQRKT